MVLWRYFKPDELELRRVRHRRGGSRGGALGAPGDCGGGGGSRGCPAPRPVASPLVRRRDCGGGRSARRPGRPLQGRRAVPDVKITGIAWSDLDQVDDLVDKLPTVTRACGCLCEGAVSAPKGARAKRNTVCALASCSSTCPNTCQALLFLLSVASVVFLATTAPPATIMLILRLLALCRLCGVARG